MKGLFVSQSCPRAAYIQFVRMKVGKEDPVLRVLGEPYSDG